MRSFLLLLTTGLFLSSASLQALSPQALIPGSFSRIPTGTDIYTHLDRTGQTVGIVTVIGHIRANPDKVYAALTNPKLTSELFPNLKKNELRRKEGDRYYFYSVLDFPWPMDDRWSLNETRYFPDIKGLSWRRTDGSVRVNEGAWRLFPSNEGTLMIYKVRFDPGLSMIPDWLLNYGMEKEAPGIIHSLRRYFEQK